MGSCWSSPSSWSSLAWPDGRCGNPASAAPARLSPPASSPPCSRAPRPAPPPALTARNRLATFTEIAKDGPSGYRSLARLQQAADKARTGDLPAALALWDQVSADEQADPSLRQVADMLWVQHQVDTGEPALDRRPPPIARRPRPALAPAGPRGARLAEAPHRRQRRRDHGTARDHRPRRTPRRACAPAPTGSSPNSASPPDIGDAGQAGISR